MTFFRAVGGKVDANTFKELRVKSDGTLYVETSSSNLQDQIDAAIASNDAYVITSNETVAKKGYYTVIVTTPDAPNTQFYVDWSWATQQEGTVKLIEDAVIGGASPVSLTFENRNRNSSDATTVTAGVILNASGDTPSYGGSEFYTHYFPRDVTARHPDGGRFILKNNTVYAFEFMASDTTSNELSVRLDLTEL
jgi:hypothetical protein